MALECAGRLDDALEQYQLGSVMSLNLPWTRALEATCLAKMRRREEARRILDALEHLRRTEYVDAYYMAMLRDALGQRTEAFDGAGTRVPRELSIPVLDRDRSEDGVAAR